MEIDTPAMDDVDAVTSLWVALARSQRAHDSHVLPEANRTTVRDAVARHVVTGGVLVARASAEDRQADDDRLAGFVTFGPETDGYETDCDRGVVESIYVRPEFRGEGIGSELLSAAESALRDAGAAAISLEVMAGNGDARRFYERHGYEPHRLELEKRTESDTDSKVD